MENTNLKIQFSWNLKLTENEEISFEIYRSLNIDCQSKGNFENNERKQ